MYTDPSASPRRTDRPVHVYEFERYLVTRVKDMIAYIGDPGTQIMYGSDWPLVGGAGDWTYD